MVAPRSPARITGTALEPRLSRGSPLTPPEARGSPYKSIGPGSASRPDAHQHVAIWKRAAPQLDRFDSPAEILDAVGRPGQPDQSCRLLSGVLLAAHDDALAAYAVLAALIPGLQCSWPALADRPGRRSMDKPCTNSTPTPSAPSGRPSRSTPASATMIVGRLIVRQVERTTPQLLRGVPAPPESRVPRWRRRAPDPWSPARRTARPLCSTRPSVLAASVVCDSALAQLVAVERPISERSALVSSG